MPPATPSPTKRTAAHSPVFDFDGVIARVGVGLTTGRLRTTDSAVGLLRSICLTPGESLTGSRTTLTPGLSAGPAGLGETLPAGAGRRVEVADS